MYSTNGRCRRAHGASKWRWILFTLLVVSVAVIAVACDRKTETAPRELTVGVIFPMSGNLGYIGQMESDGMRLAVEDLNAQTGPNVARLRLQIDDSQGKPDVAVTAAKKMMSVDKIKVIFSSISSLTLALKPTVQTNGGILIGCCMHPDFYRNSPNVFRFYEGVEQEASGFVEYFRRLAGDRPDAVTGILYADVPNVRVQLEDYIRPELKKLHMDFKVAEPYQLSDKEFRDEVSKIKAAGITNLMLLGYGFEYPNIFKALKEQKVLSGVDIVGGWGFLYTEIPKEDLEGVTVIGPKYVFQQPEEVKKFYTRFKNRFGYEANFDAAMTYAAVELLAAAVRKAPDMTPEALARELRNLSGVKTLIGTTSINDEGASEFEIGMEIIRNGF